LNKNSKIARLFLGSTYLFLYIPILFLIIFSFNKGSSLRTWEGFSFIWYQKLFAHHELWIALTNSLKVAFLSATNAVIIGLLCALWFVRFRHFRFTSWMEALSVTPLVLPEVLAGLAFLFFFVLTERFLNWPMGRGLLTITIAHTTIAVAYVTLVLRSRLLELDGDLEEAALDLGAKPRDIFFSITLPMLFPSLLASWVLAFTLSMDDLVIASFTSGPASPTLPIVVFSTLKTGLTPEMNALSTLIVLFVIALAPLSSLFLYRTFKKRP